jgi:hypothetical protein
MHEYNSVTEKSADESFGPTYNKPHSLEAPGVEPQPIASIDANVR